jgi:TolB protein
MLSIMSVDSSYQLQLTNGPQDYDPSYSPDGKKIAFARLSGPNFSRSEIWVMDTDGTHQAQLTSGSSDNAPSWSPDGKKIAYVRFRERHEIWIMNSDGSNQTLLTISRSFSPSWSPDGKKIAFVSTRYGDTDIWMMDADGSNKTQLTTDTVQEYSPSWSPDGKKIAFVRAGSIWVMELTEQFGPVLPPSLSPSPSAPEQPSFEVIVAVAGFMIGLLLRKFSSSF